MEFVRNSTIAALILACGATALVLASPQTTFADEHEDVPEGLVTAMDDYIERQGEESAGRCADADVEEDIGKWCWEIEAVLADDQINVVFGPTFSEFTNRVAFQDTELGWQIAAESLIPAPNDAPKVGTGLAEGGGTDVPDLLLITGMLLMMAGGAAYAAGRVRRTEE